MNTIFSPRPAAALCLMALCLVALICARPARAAENAAEAPAHSQLTAAPGADNPAHAAAPDTVPDSAPPAHAAAPDKDTPTHAAAPDADTPTHAVEKRPQGPDPYAQLAPPLRELLQLLDMQRLCALHEAGGGLDPAWEPLLRRLTDEGFSPEWLTGVFAGLGPHSFTPAYMGAKIAELYGVGGIGIDREALSPPQCPEGYIPPVPDATAGSCLAFMKEHEELFAAIQEAHGVDKNTLMAVLLVETAFGLDLGKDRALRVLASMALTGTAEALGGMGNQGQKQRLAGPRLTQTLRERSAWAYKELVALLEAGRNGAGDVALLPSSSMGAIGLCQFMPSNIEQFGVDGDKDGVINLFSVVDALYSAANYLEAHGWRQAGSDAHKHRVLMAYNHDSLYASYVQATARQVERAVQGKVAPGRILMAAGVVPSARLDPSLRRLKRPPLRARVQGLGDYKSLLE